MRKIIHSLKLIHRGYRILHKMNPTYLPLASAHAAILAVQPLTTLYFSARILNELTGLRDLNRIILYVVITVALNFILTAVRAVLSGRLAVADNMVFNRFSLLLSEQYMKFDFEHVEKAKVNEMLADLYAKANGNGLGILQLHWSFPGILQSVLGILFSCGLLAGMFNMAAVHTASFATTPYATILLAAAVVVSLWLTVKTRKGLQPMLDRIFKHNPKINTMYGYYYQYITSGAAGKDIRLYGQRPAIMNIMDRRSQLSIWHEYFHFSGKTNGRMGLINVIVSGGVYLFIGLRALAGMYGIGSVVQYVGAVNNLVNDLSDLISRWTSLWLNTEYLQQTYDYLDLPALKYKGTLTTEKRVDNHYEIEFKNVSFKYPGEEVYALKNLSLKLTVGKRMAVVGMNGSGKTTMIKLLCRLYDPDEGEITLNGIDIRKYEYDEYVRLFSVVFQDYKLYAFPLGQTVAASVEYDRAKVEKCLATTGLEERLKTWPKGLETALYKEYEEEGVSVSGGEAQRIAMARALYKDAPFIVLDEPTAALDPIAEYEIYSKFDEIVGSRTAIYISHRLSSCRFCDDIAVFHEGSLVQRGNHDILLTDTGGKYFELWNAQAQYYADTSHQEEDTGTIFKQ